MPTESSVVSSLIQQAHGRRLGTDPSDHLLFESTKRVHRPDNIRRTHVAVVTPQAPVYPTAPPKKRDRTWLCIVATVIAGAIGVGVAAYAAGWLDRNTRLDTATPTAVATAPIVPVVVDTPRSAVILVVEPPPSVAPDVEPTPPASTSTLPRAHRPRVKRAIAKQSVKKHRSAARTAQPRVEVAPPPPPRPTRPQRQTNDSEDPL
jgi:hypothetical protein